MVAKHFDRETNNKRNNHHNPMYEKNINNFKNLYFMKLNQASVSLAKTVKRLGETYVGETNIEIGHLDT